MRILGRQNARPRLRGMLWAAVPLAALVGGCCKTHHAAMVPADNPSVAAERGLKRIVDKLGDLAPNGKLKQDITPLANSAEGKRKLAGLNESLSEIIERSVFKEHGFYARFKGNSPEEIGAVADFLNGSTSPLQDWKGWRYRSGVVDDKIGEELGLKQPPRYDEGKAGMIAGRSIVAVIFETTPFTVQK